jgi:hypothetical protein
MASDDLVIEQEGVWSIAIIVELQCQWELGSARSVATHRHKDASSVVLLFHTSDGVLPYLNGCPRNTVSSAHQSVQILFFLMYFPWSLLCSVDIPLLLKEKTYAATE